MKNTKHCEQLQLEGYESQLGSSLIMFFWGIGSETTEATDQKYNVDLLALWIVTSLKHM